MEVRGCCKTALPSSMPSWRVHLKEELPIVNNARRKLLEASFGDFSRYERRDRPQKSLMMDVQWISCSKCGLWSGAKSLGILGFSHISQEDTGWQYGADYPATW